MSENNTYKVIELVGTSESSFSDATRSAVKRARETMDNLNWFNVVEQRGRIEDGDIEQFQVKVKVGFRLKD